jgi:protein-tyrosine phosphatase
MNKNLKINDEITYNKINNRIINNNINDGIIFNKIIIDNNIFIVSNSPIDNNLKKYINYLENEKTDIIIRVCEKKYDEKNIKKIKFIDLFTEDGNVPTAENIDKFINLCKNNKTIAIHCTFGLGRAPTFVAICDILLYKRDPYESVKRIREVIKDSFNQKQLNFLLKELSTDKFFTKCNIM